MVQPQTERVLSYKELEARHCLSGVSFAAHDIASVPRPRGPQSVSAAGLDGDGDTDVFSAYAWYENADGKGRFAPRYGGWGGESVYAADLDGDADFDVISGGHWHENADGKGSFVKHHFGSGTHVHGMDVDRDGDVDVVSAPPVFWGGPIGWSFNAAHTLTEPLEAGLPTSTRCILYAGWNQRLE